MTKVAPFAFARRQENTIIRNGIENNYDEKIPKPFTIKKLDNDDTLLGREFPTNRKTEFANHVLQHGVSEDFTHFQDLCDVVRKILGIPEKA